MSYFGLSGAFGNKRYACAFRPMGELASEANVISTIQNSFFGLFGHALDHFCMSWKPGQFDAYLDSSISV